MNDTTIGWPVVMREVSQITLVNGERVKADGLTKLTFIRTYHGDRDEHWVIEIENGNEVDRHNCRYIASIKWEHD